jgi:hypothetical protein
MLRVAKFAHQEFVVTSVGDFLSGIRPTGARRACERAQNKGTMLDRHARPVNQAESESVQKNSIIAHEGEPQNLR